MSEAEAIERAVACWDRLSNTFTGDRAEVERLMVQHRSSWMHLTPENWAETMCHSLDYVHDQKPGRRPVQPRTWWDEIKDEFAGERS